MNKYISQTPINPPIRLLILEDVPVAVEHGIRGGRFFPLHKADHHGVWVMGDAGEEVLLHSHEYTQENTHLTEDENRKQAGLPPATTTDEKWPYGTDRRV